MCDTKIVQAYDTSTCEGCPPKFYKYPRSAFTAALSGTAKARTMTCTIPSDGRHTAGLEAGYYNLSLSLAAYGAMANSAQVCHCC